MGSTCKPNPNFGTCRFKSLLEIWKRNFNLLPTKEFVGYNSIDIFLKEFENSGNVNCTNSLNFLVFIE